MTEIPEPTVRPIRIQVSCIPSASHWGLFVEYRNHRDATDWYSVTDGFQPASTIDRNGKWADEHKPTSHSPSWRKARQFELNEAIEIARRYAPDVTVNGYTVADGLRMEAAREARNQS